MRRDFSYLPPLISILLLFSGISYGQAWTGVIAPSRAIDWSHAGLPATITYGTGGNACNGSTANCVETTANPWTPPARVQSGSTITCANTASDASTINAALSAASPGSYVLLAAGTCDITSTIQLISGVTLRGSGPQSTTLNLTGTTQINSGGCCTGINTGRLTQTSYPAGTTTVQISVSNLNNLAVGNLAWFNQCDTGWTGTGTSFGTLADCPSGSYSDPGTVWTCGEVAACAVNAGTSTANYQSQYVTITAVRTAGTSGSYTCTTSSPCVSFSPGLYMSNWSSSRNAIMFWVPMGNNTSAASTYPNIGAGLEDLTVNFSFNSNELINERGLAWWVKGVRVLGGTAVSQLQISVSSHWLVTNSYLFASTYNNLLGTNSEVFLYSQDGDGLTLNNIIQDSQTFWGNGQSQGDVIAYNYGRDGGTSYYLNVGLVHVPFAAFYLYEGNEIGWISEDDTHGISGLDTDFRNYLSGWDSPYFAENSEPFQLGNYHRMVNVIGNALGGNQSVTGYQGDAYGDIYIVPGGDSTGLTTASWMRWGNCDTYTATCRFNSSEVPNSTNMSSSTYPNAVAFQNPTPGNDNLPCSFFMSGSVFTTSPCSIKTSGGTGLSWWNVCTTWTTFPTSCSATKAQPFPATGPDQTGGTYVNGTSYDIPAAVAWQNLPVDTNYQNSLTITASSWSNSASNCNLAGGQSTTNIAPCEILTVTLSGINNGSRNYIIGGFRLSGVNAACKPTSGISYTGRSDGEILMTSSSTTQIAYSLATNPGVSCTGTMLFPDVRQFDERVYMNDSGGDPSVNPPTGLNAVVQ